MLLDEAPGDQPQVTQMKVALEGVSESASVTW